jgi:hypothetical protein
MCLSAVETDPFGLPLRWFSDESLHLADEAVKFLCLPLRRFLGEALHIANGTTEVFDLAL